ncbi:MAG TPA: hypothetical protein ENJ89_09775 [Caldithrix abyssi]|uniref:Uncharacterized protein n=1 Tax=Caldithrix abyssi TaxID=187145 RepID=A0A7V5PRB4_CALAY|nr:hypothetical protein [Caldithrix abyssi]
MSLWEKLRKGLSESLQTAQDKTSEYTKIGRIKIDILGLKKEIEENFLELGGKVYHFVTHEKNYNLKKNKEIEQIIVRIKELEGELEAYEQEIKKIREEDGLDVK